MVYGLLSWAVLLTSRKLLKQTVVCFWFCFFLKGKQSKKITIHHSVYLHNIICDFMHIMLCTVLYHI